MELEQQSDDYEDNAPSCKQVKQMWQLSRPQPRRLLEEFDSIEEISGACVEELEAIPSIGEETAQKIAEDDVSYRATEQADTAATSDDAIEMLPEVGDRVRIQSRESDDEWRGDVVKTTRDEISDHEEFWVDLGDENYVIFSRRGGGAWRGQSGSERVSVDVFGV